MSFRDATQHFCSLPGWRSHLTTLISRSLYFFSNILVPIERFLFIFFIFPFTVSLECFSSMFSYFSVLVQVKLKLYNFPKAVGIWLSWFLPLLTFSIVTQIPNGIVTIVFLCTVLKLMRSILPFLYFNALWYLLQIRTEEQNRIFKILREIFEEVKYLQEQSLFLTWVRGVKIPFLMVLSRNMVQEAILLISLRAGREDATEENTHQHSDASRLATI